VAIQQVIGFAPAARLSKILRVVSFVRLTLGGIRDGSAFLAKTEELPGLRAFSSSL
jgi:hypothetical protein